MLGPRVYRRRTESALQQSINNHCAGSSPSAISAGIAPNSPLILNLPSAASSDSSGELPISKTSIGPYKTKRTSKRWSVVLANTVRVMGSPVLRARPTLYVSLHLGSQGALQIQLGGFGNQWRIWHGTNSIPFNQWENLVRNKVNTVQSLSCKDRGITQNRKRRRRAVTTTRSWKLQA